MKGGFHDELEIEGGVAMIKPSERCDIGVGVDVDGYHLVRLDVAIAVDLEVNIVGALLNLNKPVDALVISLHILSVVVLVTAQVCRVVFTQLSTHEIGYVRVTLRTLSLLSLKLCGICW